MTGPDKGGYVSQASSLRGVRERQAEGGRKTAVVGNHLPENEINGYG